MSEFEWGQAGQVVDKRLWQRVSLVELFALALCFGMVGIFAWYQSQGKAFSYDFETYLLAGNGDLEVHYYAFWILPVFRILAALPLALSFVLWNLLNVLGVFFASRILGGEKRWVLALLTYQMFYVLYYGNIVGILIGGLALLWWGLTHNRWHVAGLGLIVALTKYQLGISFGFIYLLVTEISLRNRLKVLVVPLITLLLSLLIYPFWPLESLHIILTNPPNSLGNISLWQWIGPFALALWLPPLFLPISAHQRLVALAATATITLPYFQQTDLLALFVLPLGWLPLAGNLGFYLFAKYNWQGFAVLALIPLFVYLRIIGPHMFSWLRKKIANYST